MSSTYVTGRPGGHPSRIFRERLMSAAYPAGGVCAMLIGALCLLGARVNMVVVAAVLLLACWPASMVRTAWVSAKKASIGARAEKEAFRVARRARPLALVAEADLGAHGDCDMIVITPAGLVAVEVKAGGGAVSATSDGGLLTGGGRRRIPKDPVGQSRRQATAAARRAGVPACAVVCVNHMSNDPFMVGDVIVCGLRDLPSVIERRSGVGAISETAARRIADLLAAPPVHRGR